jgi:phosphonate transport system substrate-binding protein
VRASDDVLRFTAIPSEQTTDLALKFGPVADYLSETLGIEVEYVPSTDYPASVELFKNGDVQLAWFGGLTGVQARRAVDGALAIAQGKVDPEYKSYFIAHVDTGLEMSDDFPFAIARLSFTFGSNSSTSGRLMPEHFIRAHTGKSPGEFFGRPMNFSGSHDKTAELVEAGTFQAGVLDYKTYERRVAAGELDPAVCRTIWVTPTYADYNWSAHPVLEQRFGEGFTDRLQTALISMRAPELLAAINRPEGLIPATNQDFDALRSLALEDGLLD